MESLKCAGKTRRQERSCEEEEEEEVVVCVKALLRMEFVNVGEKLLLVSRCPRASQQAEFWLPGDLLISHGNIVVPAFFWAT